MLLSTTSAGNQLAVIVGGSRLQRGSNILAFFSYLLQICSHLCCISRANLSVTLQFSTEFPGSMTISMRSSLQSVYTMQSAGASWPDTLSSNLCFFFLSFRSLF